MNLTTALAWRLALAAAAAPAAADDAVTRGAQIYREGSSPRGTPITAGLGGGAAVPATLLPCINCHGADGRGRSEGGVRPADITPAVLARALQDERRARPAYDTSRLRRAITLGFDAGNQPLDGAMPRYALSQADMADLLAYLDALAQRREPGVSAGSIRIGVIGATPRTPAQTIYGRRIEVVAARDADLALLIDVGPEADASLAAAARDGLPTLAFAATADPGASAWVVTAAPARQQRVLDDLAAALPARQVLRDCATLAANGAARLLLLDAQAAAACELEQLVALDGLEVRVAAAAPPDPELRAAVAQDLLDGVVGLLQRAGHGFTRESLRSALEQAREWQVADLPPLRWSRERRRGLDQVWVMRLDPQTRRLLPAPGWVAAQ